MRLPRMTIRRWMVVVAVVGLVMGGMIGGYRLKRRRDGFVIRVRYHAVLGANLVRKTAVECQ
jgi:putative exporter of polyketide antibiotics